MKPVARATSLRVAPVIVGTPNASRSILTGAPKPVSACSPSSWARLRRICHQPQPTATATSNASTPRVPRIQPSRFLTTDMGSLRPSQGSYGVAAFVEFIEIKHGLDRLALEPELHDALLEVRRGFVAPAAVHHESVPDRALVVGARAAPLMAPRENFGVGAALQGAG